MSAEILLAGIMLAALTLYLLGGGADFGGGVWDLLASGPRAKDQRALIEKSIGPIWEANHVWFIFVFTVFFAAFPPAFSFTVTALFMPLTIYAVGIVLRGAAFTFRHYDPERSHSGKWSLMFSGASLLCPFLLGTMGAALSRDVPLTSPLLGAFTVSGGFFLVALVAALAASYLAVDAGESPLAKDFKTRAMAALLTAGGFGLLTLVLARTSAPTLYARILGMPLPWIVATLVGLAALGLLHKKKYAEGRVATAALLVVVVAAWAWAKGTTLARGEGGALFTIENSKSHPATLTTLIYACAAGSAVLFPSLFLLFRVFGSSQQANKKS